ncbi:MAG: helix-turn-helix transcriptional regulator [Patulibacter sp.]|nr:helix-turn-helix transcriptional regulator [Patulibacter sp.]
MLTGAKANLATVERVVQRGGSGGALVLRGVPASGRSTLLDHAARTVDGRTTVVRAGGSPSEAGLPFGLLHQLLVPFEAQVADLPPVQASAVASVLQLSDGPPDPAAVGCGLRTLLVRLARRHPVLVLVDDIDQADAASADALGFAARRVAGEPITVLLTACPRRVPSALVDLPTWDVRPFSRGEAVRFVHGQTDVGCPRGVAAILWAATDGLPGELERVVALLPRSPRADDAPHQGPPNHDRLHHDATHHDATPSADASSADRLLIRTATAAWRNGDGVSAMRLVAHVSDRAARSGEVRRLQGLFELRCGVPEVASDILVQAAGALPSATGLRVLVEAAEAALFAGDVDRMTAIAVRGRTLVVDHAEDGHGPLLAFLEGVAATFAGRPEHGVPMLAAASRAGTSVIRPQEVVQAGIAAITTGDAATARILLTRAVRRARVNGATGITSNALAFLAISEILLGRYAEASDHAREGLSLARSLDHPTTEAGLLAALALSAAFRGALDDCRTQAEETLRLAVGQSLGLAGATAEWALGVADVACGDVASATDRLHAIETGETGTGHPLIALLSAPHLAESAVRAGRPDVARAALDRFLPFAVACGQPWAGALALRMRALLAADADDADALFARANALHTRADRPFEHARTLCLWGVRLRTDHQRAAAAARLRTAAAMLGHLGDGAWAEQARAELRVLGTPNAPMLADEHPELTVREREIVRHVRRGSTNREIAARLFLSTRTVDHHLRNVFRKLEIRSRTELLADDTIDGTTGVLRPTAYGSGTG